MLAYKFLDATFGLKSLSERRLKISTLEDLNDPFELMPFDLRNRANRLAVKRARDQLAAKRGMLCFSATWKDPVLWAHYADKHRGLCIGFEIPDQAAVTRLVEYVPNRLPFPLSLGLADIERMLFTKFQNWEYEQEVRIFLALNDRENGLYFRSFDNLLNPVVVIAGARCTLPKQTLRTALGVFSRTVKLIKSRAGFRSFEVVVDKRGFR
jgi:hypothetical protein